MNVIFLILLLASCGSEEEFNEEVYFKPILKCLAIEGETCETGTDESLGASGDNVEEDIQEGEHIL